jgi:hypothetical protein
MSIEDAIGLFEDPNHSIDKAELRKVYSQYFS